jgi:hypothetical protein
LRRYNEEYPDEPNEEEAREIRRARRAQLKMFKNGGAEQSVTVAGAGSSESESNSDSASDVDSDSDGDGSLMGAHFKPWGATRDKVRAGPIVEGSRPNPVRAGPPGEGSRVNPAAPSNAARRSYSEHGRAVQVDSVKTRVESAPGFGA